MGFVKFIFYPILFAFGILVFLSMMEEVKQIPTGKNLPQTEINRVAMLISGIKPHVPDEFGWMKKPLRIFNEHSLSQYQKLRLKKWDYFDIFTEDGYYLSVAFADLTYLGKIKILAFDFNTRKFVKVERDILPWKIPKLSTTSYKMHNSTKDDVVYEASNIKYRIHNVDAEATATYHSRQIDITTTPENFNFHLRMNMTSDHEIIGMVTPMSADKTLFYYNLKFANIPIDGTVNVFGKEIAINRDTASAGMDWGRGVWPYTTLWVWARGQGFLPDGHRFGLNLGGGFANAEANTATEDSFFVDKYMYKLDTTYFTYDDNNLMNPFTFKTEDRKKFQECDIVFKPNQMDTSHENYIVAMSDFRRVFGQFSGWVSNSDGKKYHFENINGLVEVHKAKW